MSARRLIMFCQNLNNVFPAISIETMLFRNFHFHLRSLFACLFMVLCLQACVSFPDAPPPITQPVLAGNVIQTADGALLGVQRWEAQSPKAVVLAVHGMNDYANAFALPGAWWAEHARITTYAIDQRGFGRSPNFGYWVGEETMIADIRAAIAAIREAHPETPVYVLGHSMGAAVVMAAEDEKPLGADGLILAAPGVWGGRALPLPYRLTLNMAAGLAPGKTLTGERAERQSTDNIELLRQMYYDPLVIKETRLDAVLGVVRVMGRAYGAAENIDGNILLLFGEKDEIIPLKAMEKTARRLSGNVEIKRYDNGWHLILRDLQAETVWHDIAHWVAADIRQ